MKNMNAIIKTTNADDILAKVEKEKMRKEIGYILSPGSISTRNLYPPSVLPTGGNFFVLQETKQVDMTFSPDASGSIVLLLLPFFEAPLVRIELDSSFNFVKWYAVQLPGYEFNVNNKDPLKNKHYYAYRFIANSLTATCTTSLTTTQGSVHAWNQPLSLDTKRVYKTVDTNDMAMPIQNMRTLDRVPVTLDQISKVTKTYYTGSASQGAYVVGRHTDPNMPFTYRDCDENKATVSVYCDNLAGLAPASDAELHPITYENYLCYADDIYPGVYLKSSDAADALPLPVSAPTCVDLSGIIFSGLPTNAGATVNAKMIVTVEEIPKYNADNLGYAKPMPPRDDFFMDTLFKAEQKAPRCGNAASNSFGSFVNVLDGIMSGLGGIAKVIAPALPPQVSPIVSGLATAIPKLTNTINAAVNSNKQTQKQVAALANTMAQSQVQNVPNVVSNYTVPSQQFTPAATRPVTVRRR